MSLSKPYTFVSATTIMASEVNSDFDTLFTAIGNQMYTEENYIVDDQTVTASLDALDMKVKDHADYYPDLARYSIFQRAQFTYNGGVTAYTVKVGAASYWCKDKYCYWASELTTGAIGTPVASTWYYLYLDYSEIASGTAIVAGKLIWSSTAPTWNGTYRGWYNTDDRCIFAAKTNDGPTNILECFHSGSFVLSADIGAANSVQPSDVWTDLVLDIPTFVTAAKVTIYHLYSNAATFVRLRTNEQTGTTGHVLAVVTSAFATQYIPLDIITDSAQTVEVSTAVASTNTVGAYVDGWYFPIGM